MKNTSLYFQQTKQLSSNATQNFLAQSREAALMKAQLLTRFLSASEILRPEVIRGCEHELVNCELCTSSAFH